MRFILYKINKGYEIYDSNEKRLIPFRVESVDFQLKKNDKIREQFKSIGMLDFYETWKSLTPSNCDKLIPPVFIDGFELSKELNRNDSDKNPMSDYENYYLIKLDSKDPRCAYLG